LAEKRLFNPRCVGDDAGRNHAVSGGEIRGKDKPEKPSAEPDFLAFLSKTGLIHKKHMIFDKKYILFSTF